MKEEIKGGEQILEAFTAFMEALKDEDQDKKLEKVIDDSLNDREKIKVILVKKILHDACFVTYVKHNFITDDNKEKELKLHFDRMLGMIEYIEKHPNDIMKYLIDDLSNKMKDTFEKEEKI